MISIRYGILAMLINLSAYSSVSFKKVLIDYKGTPPAKEALDKRVLPSADYKNGYEFHSMVVKSAYHLGSLKVAYTGSDYVVKPLNKEAVPVHPDHFDNPLKDYRAWAVKEAIEKGSSLEVDQFPNGQYSLKLKSRLRGNGPIGAALCYVGVWAGYILPTIYVAREVAKGADGAAEKVKWLGAAVVIASGMPISTPVSRQQKRAEEREKIKQERNAKRDELNRQEGEFTAAGGKVFYPSQDPLKVALVREEQLDKKNNPIQVVTEWKTGMDTTIIIPGEGKKVDPVSLQFAPSGTHPVTTPKGDIICVPHGHIINEGLYSEEHDLASIEEDFKNRNNGLFGPLFTQERKAHFHNNTVVPLYEFAAKAFFKSAESIATRLKCSQEEIISAVDEYATSTLTGLVMPSMPLGFDAANEALNKAGDVLEGKVPNTIKVTSSQMAQAAECSMMEAAVSNPEMVMELMDAGKQLIGIAVSSETAALTLIAINKQALAAAAWGGVYLPF